MPTSYQDNKETFTNNQILKKKLIYPKQRTKTNNIRTKQQEDQQTNNSKTNMDIVMLE